MPQTALLKKASVTAAAMRKQNAQVLADAAKRAAEIARQRELHRHSDLRRSCELQRQTAERVGRALKAINALCAIGASPEMQALLTARGRPLHFWGGQESITAGFDMSDIYWKWVSFIELTPHALRIHNYTGSSGDYGSTYRIDDYKGMRPLRLDLSYAAEDDLLRSRPLWRIATHRPLDEEERVNDVNYLYSTERLFETLVAMADPKRLGKQMRRAMEAR